MNSRPVCISLVVLTVAAGFLTAPSRAADQETVQPSRSTQTVETPPPVRSSPAMRPATGLRPSASSAAPRPRIPLSQVDFSHLAVQYAGDAPDSTFIVELQRQSGRTGWQEAVLANNLAIQAMEGMNEDKKYWLGKLKEMNAIADALSGYMRDLWDAAEDAINTGEDHGHDSKEGRRRHIRDQQAWDAYWRCVDTPPEERPFPDIDCIYPAWAVEEAHPTRSATLVFQSLDRLDAAISRLDINTLTPEDREFIESLEQGSRHFRKLVQRQERLSQRFPYKPPSRPPPRTAPTTAPRQLPAVRTAPVREMKKAPVAPQPAQPVKPVTPLMPMAPDTKKSKEAR